MASLARGGLDLDKIWPIGSVYISVNSTDPSSLFGGKWEQLKDRFLLGCGTKTNGTTGGEENHTLTEAELPVIDGSFRTPVVGNHQVYGVRGHAYGSNWSDGKTTNEYSSGSGAVMNWGYGYKFGGGQAHNNMPPYLVVYMWKRVS